MADDEGRKKKKKFKAVVSLQEACAAGDLSKAQAALERHPIPAAQSRPVSFDEAAEGMKVQLHPQVLRAEGSDDRCTGVVLRKTHDAVLLCWNAPQKNGPPTQVGGAAFPREREESRDWWDGGAEPVHVTEWAAAPADDAFRTTGLHYAATYGHEASVRYVVDSGADVNAQTSDVDVGGARLAGGGAAQVGQAGVYEGRDAEGRWLPITILAQDGAYVHAKQYAGGAHDGRDPKLVKLAATDVRHTSGGGHTPLMCAAHNGQARIVRALLDRGADPAALNAAFRTAADFARDAGHNAVANHLDRVERGCHFAKDAEQAAAAGDALWLKWAMREGMVDAAWRGAKGETLLYVAVRGVCDAPETAEGSELAARCRKVVDFLLLRCAVDVDAIAQPEEKGAPAMNALMLASSRAKPELVELLLREGADAARTNKADGGGKTATDLCPKGADEPAAPLVRAMLSAALSRGEVDALRSKKDALAAADADPDERKEWKQELAKAKKAAAALDRELAELRQRMAAPPPAA